SGQCGRAERAAGTWSKGTLDRGVTAYTPGARIRGLHEVGGRGDAVEEACRLRDARRSARLGLRTRDVAGVRADVRRGERPAADALAGRRGRRLRQGAPRSGHDGSLRRATATAADASSRAASDDPAPGRPVGGERLPAGRMP